MTRHSEPAREAVAQWPERLTLRDTKVVADEGQRIFTTATGYGYEKREYVRADLATPAPSASGLPADETIEQEFDAVLTVFDKHMSDEAFLRACEEASQVSKIFRSRPLASPPAPAVESALVKEAFFKGFSAGESYHNSKWHHYKAPDLNTAWDSYRTSLAETVGEVEVGRNGVPLRVTEDTDWSHLVSLVKSRVKER